MRHWGGVERKAIASSASPQGASAAAVGARIDTTDVRNALPTAFNRSQLWRSAARGRGRSPKRTLVYVCLSTLASPLDRAPEPINQSAIGRVRRDSGRHCCEPARRTLQAAVNAHRGRGSFSGDENLGQSRHTRQDMYQSLSVVIYVISIDFLVSRGV